MHPLRLIPILLLYGLAMPPAWAQLFPNEREQAAHEEVIQLLERYSDGLNAIGNPDEDLDERKTYYVGEFKKVFRQPEVLVFNDIEPNRRSGNDLPADRYAVNHIIWFPKSGITTRLNTKEITFSPIQKTASGNLFVNAYVTKNVKGRFMDRELQSTSHRLEFRVGLVDKGRYFSDFRIIGVTEIPDTTTSPKSLPDKNATVSVMSPVNPTTFHQTLATLVDLAMKSGLPKGLPIRVEKFTYAKTGLCSQFSKVLNNFLVVRLREQPGLIVLPPPADLPAGARTPPADPASIRIEGSFTDDNDHLALQLNWTDLQTKKRTSIPVQTVPLTEALALKAPLRPDNLGQAVAMQKALQKDSIRSDFEVSVLTNRGNGRLTFTEGDSLKLYVRAAKPCYLRFIYHTADGQHVLLDDNYYVDSLNVNRYVKIQKFFTVTEPFGTEVLQLNAATRPFPALTLHQEAGFAIITDDIPTINQKNRRAGDATNIRRAETWLTLTTTQKLK
ncbi:hypothetical protein [Spirosoma jeollabukense]